jgi:hypothetical protein
MKSAVLFLVFNRPETTRKVFEAIRAAAPPRLYVAADGPRTNREGEKERCAEVRRIATGVDWPCRVKTLFRDSNLGCRLAVSGGIDWFFENEEEGVILEDDVLPLASFFPYCDELLERYRQNDRIALISGSNLISHKFSPNESYFFSRIVFIWGWASWRRAWRHYDVAMASWPEWRDMRGPSRLFPADSLVARYWKDIFASVHSGKIDTWDYQWIYACWRRGALCLLPGNNLTHNLGFGTDATHTSAETPSYVVDSAPEEVVFPLIHPECVEPDRSPETLAFRHIYRINARNELRRWIRTTPVVGSLLATIKRYTMRARQGSAACSGL